MAVALPRAAARDGTQSGSGPPADRGLAVHSADSGPDFPEPRLHLTDGQREIGAGISPGRGRRAPTRWPLSIRAPAARPWTGNRSDSPGLPTPWPAGPGGGCSSPVRRPTRQPWPAVRRHLDAGRRGSAGPVLPAGIHGRPGGGRPVRRPLDRPAAHGGGPGLATVGLYPPVVTMSPDRWGPAGTSEPGPGARGGLSGAADLPGGKMPALQLHDPDL